MKMFEICQLDGKEAMYVGDQAGLPCFRVKGEDGEVAIAPQDYDSRVKPLKGVAKQPTEEQPIVRPSAKADKTADTPVDESSGDRPVDQFVGKPAK